MSKIISELSSFDYALAVKALEHLKLQEQLNYSFYKPNPIQFQFHKLGKEGARDRLIMAANRFGKTTAGGVETSAHLTGNYPLWWPGYIYLHPTVWWVACVDEKAILDMEHKFFTGGEFCPWIHESLVEKGDKSKHIYQIKNRYGGLSHLEFKTYQQQREAWQYKRLHGLWYDEEPRMDLFVEGGLRLMSTSPKHYTMSYTTATCLHEDQFTQTFTTEIDEFLEYDDFIQEYVTKQRIIQRPAGEIKDGYVYITAGWDDAPHLTEEEKARRLKSIPLDQRSARTKGIPAVGGGMVYPIMEHLITYDPFEIPNHFYLCAGIDFGWVHPTAMVFGALDKDKDILYIFEEYRQSERTPQQHLSELMRMRQVSDLIAGMPFAHDPAGGARSQKDGESLVKLYSKAGIKMTSANNSIEGGVQTVLQRMQNGRLRISTSCTKLLSEIRMYARDEKTSKVRDGNDDLVDALRYLVMTGLSIALPKYQVKDPHNPNLNNIFHYNYPRNEAGFI